MRDNISPCIFGLVQTDNGYRQSNGIPVLYNVVPKSASSRTRCARQALVTWYTVAAELLM